MDFGIAAKIALVTAASKGLGRGNPWDEIAAAGFALAGKPLRPLV